MAETPISLGRSPRSTRWIEVLIAAAFFSLMIILYWRVGHFEFINFDDPKYIDPPSRVREGFTFSSIWWAATTLHFNWHPLTWMSLMMDYSLFGGTPGAIHMHSAVLHAINCVLLFVVLLRLTGNLWPAAIATSLFAMHPLRVEPVAWVSARKDVLSSMFWLLTMLAYSAYVHCTDSRRKSLRFYLLTLIAMSLGLMSKGMLVSMPLALLVLDYWPLRRFDAVALLRLDPQARRQFAKLVFEKFPMMLLAIIGSWVTVVAQLAVGAISGTELTLRDRLGNAIISYVQYLRMTVAPYGLAFFYPHPAMLPRVGISAWQVAGSLALLIFITLAVIAVVRRMPWLLAGWVWYMITLVPVIGIVQIGAQALADRYSYIPSIGLCIAAAWSIEALAEPTRRIARAIAIILALVLMALSWQQVATWRDSETVMVHAIRVTPNNFVAHSNLGGVYDVRGEPDKALREHLTVLEIVPEDAIALSYLAGRAAAENNTAEAMKLFQRSIDAKPTPALAYNNFGNFLRQIGRSDDAVKLLRTAISIDSEMPSALHNLALALASQGKVPEAIPIWQRAVALNPDHVEAHFGLAQAFLVARRDRDAIVEFRAALKVAPNRADILANLAWGLATNSVAEYRDGPQAVQLAQRACDLTHQKDAISLDSLAAGQALVGEFKRAAENAHLAADLAKSDNNTNLAQQIERRIALYEKGEPYISGR